MSDETHKPTLALTMICRDEVADLGRCLESASAVGFDETVIGWTGSDKAMLKLFKQHKCNVLDIQHVLSPLTAEDLAAASEDMELSPDAMGLHEGDMVMRDFGEARNIVADASTAEFAMWLDSDDTLEHADRIKPSLSAFEINPNLGAIWCIYKYAHDDAGRCILPLPRERITRRQWFRWVGKLHEVQIQQIGCQHLHMHHCDKPFYVRHNATDDVLKAHLARNVAIVGSAYRAEIAAGKIDARTLWDYARTLMTAGRKERALKILEQFVMVSGWPEQIFYAYIRIADIHREAKRYDAALSAATAAMRICPTWPDSKLSMAMTYMQLEAWEDAMHMIGDAERCEAPIGRMPVNPLDYEAKPLVLKQRCLFNMAPASGDSVAMIDRAREIAKEALVYFPANNYLADCVDKHKMASDTLKRQRSFVALAEQFEEAGDEERLDALCKALHPDDADLPIFARLKSRGEGRSADNRVVIYCGETYEEWSPNSIATGIGGSEEAVIYMSQELVKRGWVVDVYGLPGVGQDGLYDGVHYHNYWAYDRETPAAVFVAWRIPGYCTLAPEGALNVLWLHDVQETDRWLPTAVEAVDKVMVLSGWHARQVRDTIAALPSDKLWITRNGIVPAHFESNGVVRAATRSVYTSSPDRGLRVLLDLWPKVREAKPEATLNVFYGFTPSSDNRHRGEPRYNRYREEVLAKLKQPGVHFHGRRGQVQLAQFMKRCGTWPYPTAWPEISCISAMKAQAAGVIPVHSNYAALSETCFAGIGRDLPNIYTDEKEQAQFLEMWIEAMDVPADDDMRHDMSRKAIDRYSWAPLADEWDAEFKALVAEKKEG